MMENIAIKVENITKDFRIYQEKTDSLPDFFHSVLQRRDYQLLRVLDDISFEVQKGQVVGIIGRNGAGKTTLLRILAKIIRPTSGKVYTNGRISALLRLGIGFNPNLNAKDNIVIYGMILGLSKSEITKKVPEVLEYSELEKFASTPIRHFSSGMSARLAFATAMTVDPDILIVDETLAVGDVKFGQKSFKTFSTMKDKNKTIIFVSHNLSQVKQICDSAIFLHEGKIGAMGDPAEVIKQYMEIVGEKEPIMKATQNVTSNPNHNIFVEGSVFLKNPATIPNRLRWRTKALFDDNSFAFKNKSVLDLDCRDGRFMYAAIMTGAKFVQGIGNDKGLLELCRSNLESYGIDASQYAILNGNTVSILRSLKPHSFETILCFDLFKSLDINNLLKEITRLDPSFLVIDSDVNRPFRSKLNADNKGAISPVSKDEMISLNKKTIGNLLNKYNFDFKFLDWQDMGVVNWTGLEDYHKGNRASILATKKNHVSNNL